MENKTHRNSEQPYSNDSGSVRFVLLADLTSTANIYGYAKIELEQVAAVGDSEKIYQMIRVDCWLPSIILTITDQSKRI